MIGDGGRRSERRRSGRRGGWGSDAVLILDRSLVGFRGAAGRLRVGINDILIQCRCWPYRVSALCGMFVECLATSVASAEIASGGTILSDALYKMKQEMMMDLIQILDSTLYDFFCNFLCTALRCSDII
jgi:hypothetical protein